MKFASVVYVICDKFRRSAVSGFRYKVDLDFGYLQEEA